MTANDNPGERTDRLSGSRRMAPGENVELPSHSFSIRVRYQETDAQGHAHHTTYVNYFEIGRIEMLRAAGHSYRELEEQGLRLVVVEVGCRYFAPARYDDLLNLCTTLKHSRGARIRHEYEIRRDGELIVTGFTEVASVDRDGRVCRLPEFLQLRPARSRR